VNLTAPRFVDAFDANGVVIPRFPDSYSPHRGRR
jgi:hypothetical protein